MKFDYVAPPRQAPIIVSSNSTGNVMHGQGLMRGSAGGAIGASILVAGPLRGTHRDGVGGNPRLTMLPISTEIAFARIDLSSPLPQRIDIIADMANCEIEQVSFRNFSARPPASLQGGIYAAPPTGAGAARINPPRAMIVPETTTYDSWAGEMSAFHAPLVNPVRRPVFLFWCPRLINGVAASGPAGLTCEVIIKGLPKWQG